MIIYEQWLTVHSRLEAVEEGRIIDATTEKPYFALVTTDQQSYLLASDNQRLFKVMEKRSKFRNMRF